MAKETLLEEYVRLLIETGEIEVSNSTPFMLQEPPEPRGSQNRGEYAISREFPLHCAPDLALMIGVTDEDLEDGVLNGEHEITLNCDIHSTPGAASRDPFEPPDHGDFEIQDFTPMTIDGVALSAIDAERLKRYLGNLTRDEADSISQQHSPPERDYPEPYDDY